jgi:EAL domain-containing protein (putative c-di-GMP-specific phosphodiesterase class I)
MTVIIEGIENDAELQATTDLGADAVQGFHLGQAMSADTFSAALGAGPS